MTEGEWQGRCRICNHTETEHGPGINPWNNNCKVCGCRGFQPCDCETCQGAPGYPPQCESCGGKGQIQVKTEDDDYDSDGCEHCGGTGQRLVAGEESGQLCVHCGGGGVLEVRQGSYPNGMYFISSVCPRCLGTGVQP